jgi:L-lactate permease
MTVHESPASILPVVTLLLLLCIENLNLKARLAIQIIVSAIILLIAFYVLSSTPVEKQWAYLTIGVIIGYWARRK